MHLIGLVTHKGNLLLKLFFHWTLSSIKVCPPFHLSSGGLPSMVISHSRYSFIKNHLPMNVSSPLGIQSATGHYFRHNLNKIFLVSVLFSSMFLILSLFKSKVFQSPQLLAGLLSRPNQSFSVSSSRSHSWQNPHGDFFVSWWQVDRWTGDNQQEI